MAEVSKIASVRLARLRENFLTMSPEAQLQFTQALRDRRARPAPLKRALKGKANAKKKSSQSPENPEAGVEKLQACSDDDAGYAH